MIKMIEKINFLKVAEGDKFDSVGLSGATAKRNPTNDEKTKPTLKVSNGAGELRLRSPPSGTQRLTNANVGLRSLSLATPYAMMSVSFRDFLRNVFTKDFKYMFVEKQSTNRLPVTTFNYLFTPVQMVQLLFLKIPKCMYLLY